MAFRIVEVDAQTTTQFFTVEGVATATYEDDLNNFVASLPVQKRIGLSPDGYVSSAFVTIIGGQPLPAGGITTGGWPTAKASVSLSIGGFEPGKDVRVTGHGPAGREVIVETADGSGVVNFSARIIPFTAASLASGEIMPTTSVVVEAFDRVLATLGEFPHKLWNDPLYAGFSYKDANSKLFHPNPRGPQYSPIPYLGQRPGSYRAYAESVNVGPVETHPAPPGWGVIPVARMDKYRIDFNNQRRGGVNNLSGNRDAVFLTLANGVPSASFELKPVPIPGYRFGNGPPNECFYKVDSSGKFLELARRSTVGHVYLINLAEGECLMICAATFGARPSHMPQMYAQFDQSYGDLGYTTGNVDNANPFAQKTFHEITTRKIIRVKEPYETLGGNFYWRADQKSSVLSVEITAR